jgi:hypothetical protein
MQDSQAQGPVTAFEMSGPDDALNCVGNLSVSQNPCELLGDYEYMYVPVVGEVLAFYLSRSKSKLSLISDIYVCFQKYCIG